MQKNEVFIESPTRIDFAGGTLDCWPINAIMGDVTTINVAISIYTSCRLIKRDDQKIKVISREMNKTFEFESINEVKESFEKEFLFFKEHILFWNPDFGFELSAQSDSPVGGGLGGSSSLSVSIFKAFNQMMKASYDQYETVRFCSGIEAQILKTPTGTQDYFPPIEGGINIIDYKSGWPKVIRIPVKNLNLDSHISVFFTGKSHHSGINNWLVMKKFIDGDQKTVNALEKIKLVASECRDAIINGQFSLMPQLFNKEYEARMDLAESFSSPEIEKLTEIALASGGEALKICGAGGGGCVFVWSKPTEKQRVIKACTEAGFKHLDVQLI